MTLRPRFPRLGADQPRRLDRCPAFLGLLLSVALCVMATGCSGEAQVRSQLISSLDQVQSDLRKVGLTLEVDDRGRVLSTTADVSVEYALRDAAKAQQAVATLNAGSAAGRRQQRAADDVLGAAVNAIVGAEDVLSGTAKPSVVSRDLRHSIRQVAALRNHLARAR